MTNVAREGSKEEQPSELDLKIELQIQLRQKGQQAKGKAQNKSLEVLSIGQWWVVLICWGWSMGGLRHPAWGPEMSPVH